MTGYDRLFWLYVGFVTGYAFAMLLRTLDKKLTDRMFQQIIERESWEL